MAIASVGGSSGGGGSSAWTTTSVASLIAGIGLIGAVLLMSVPSNSINRFYPESVRMGVTADSQFFMLPVPFDGQEKNRCVRADFTPYYGYTATASVSRGTAQTLRIFNTASGQVRRVTRWTISITDPRDTVTVYQTYWPGTSCQDMYDSADTLFIPIGG